MQCIQKYPANRIIFICFKIFDDFGEFESSQGVFVVFLGGGGGGIWCAVRGRSGLS